MSNYIRTPEAARQRLFESLSLRIRPEDAADDIRLIYSDQSMQIPSETMQLLSKAARNSLAQSIHGYTSMAQKFFEAVPMSKQIGTAKGLFEPVLPDLSIVDSVNPRDPDQVLDFIKAMGQFIQKNYSENDFLKDRMNRVARKERGLWCQGHRKYNKCWRYLVMAEKKLKAMVINLRKAKFIKVGKSGLSSQLSKELFEQDIYSACFIAYMTAKSNMRAEFTLIQDSRYDEIADNLLNLAINRGNCNWFGIAHVFINSVILQNLTDEQKGILLGQWYNLLCDIGQFLQQIFETSHIDTHSMIVKRGNNSMDWNVTASSWNKSRSNWLALLLELDLDQLLNTHCPGKVLRLMAADLQYWRQAEGMDVHVDTYVWRELPKPWEVLLNGVECPRSLVEEVCRKHNLDPDQSGWTGIRPDRIAIEYKPTPELVHGVTVSSPFLATIFKKAGFFSGGTGGEWVREQVIHNLSQSQTLEMFQQLE